MMIVSAFKMRCIFSLSYWVQLSSFFVYHNIINLMCRSKWTIFHSLPHVKTQPSMKILVFSFHRAYPYLLKDDGLLSESLEVISFLLGRLVLNTSHDMMSLVEKVTLNTRRWDRMVNCDI